MYHHALVLRVLLSVNYSHRIKIKFISTLFFSRMCSILDYFYNWISFLGSNSNSKRTSTQRPAVTLDQLTFKTYRRKLLLFHLLPVMGHLGFSQQSSVSSNICYKTADTAQNPVCWFNSMLFLCFLLLSVDLVRSPQVQSVLKLSFRGRQIKPNKEGCDLRKSSQ